MKNFSSLKYAIDAKKIDEKLEKYYSQLKETKEEWRHIKINGKPSKYMISNHGRYYNPTVNRINDFKNYQERYYRITLYDNNKKYKFSVHRLVAEYFCEIPKKYLEQGLGVKDLVPNHINGIKHCNAYFNLEWTTHRENSLHAWNEGLCDNIREEKNHLSKLKNQDVITICKLLNKETSLDDILRIVPKATERQIRHIKSGECWRSISKIYLTNEKMMPKVKGNTKSNVIKICKLLETGKYSDVEIAKMVNISRTFVRDVREKRRRKDISVNYNF